MRSQYLIDKILQAVGTNLYVSFFDGDPVNGGKEIATSRGVAIMTKQADGVGIENKNKISLFATTGIARFWGVYDARTGGNLLYYFPVENEFSILGGEAVYINPKSLIIREK